MTPEERALLHSMVIDARMAAYGHPRYQKYATLERVLCESPTYRAELRLLPVHPVEGRDS